MTRVIQVAVPLPLRTCFGSFQPLPIAAASCAQAPGWRYERIELPPAFAPTLPPGVETLWFAPGMFDPAAADYFTYVFSLDWNEPLEPEAELALGERHLAAQPAGAEALPDLLDAYRREAEGKPGRAFVGLVHRLDRNVSGAMVVAKTSKAAARLSACFRDRREERALKVVAASPSGRGRPRERSEKSLFDVLSGIRASACVSLRGAIDMRKRGGRQRDSAPGPGDPGALATGRSAPGHRQAAA